MAEIMKKVIKIEDLRKAQRDFNSKYHLESIKVSIDRLTVLVDCLNPMRLAVELERRLSKELEQSVEFHVKEMKNGLFGLEYVSESDERINLIYFEVVNFREVLLRIDFNPNSLKEYGAMEIWRKIILFLTLNGVEMRLSRFDLAFDIYNMPSVLTAKHTKGGVSSVFYYDRANELETVYWGSRSSNVQVRLYDKNKERIKRGKLSEVELYTSPYWWRFEMQLRTKAINADMVSEVIERLGKFGIYDYSKLGGNRAFTYIFLQDESMLPLIFNYLKPSSMKMKKQRLRKKLREIEEEFRNKMVSALRNQSQDLSEELKQYTQEFLGF